MTDQGREFVNKVNEELFLLTGSDHRISSAYHPQTNGLDERMNQTLSGVLVKFVNDSQDDWDIHLKSVLFAYRTSRNDSTKFTPYELMFGREPMLPIELEIRSKPESLTNNCDATSFQEKVNVMKDVRERVKEQAMENIFKAQDRQKRSYDRKHQPLLFKVGDSVLLRNMRNDARKGGKLERIWSGPYTISQILHNSIYFTCAAFHLTGWIGFLWLPLHTHTVIDLFLTLSLPSSKTAFSKPRKENCITEGSESW